MNEKIYVNFFCFLGNYFVFPVIFTGIFWIKNSGLYTKNEESFFIIEMKH